MEVVPKDVYLGVLQEDVGSLASKPMPRPKIPRAIRFRPDVYYFKPRGIPLHLLDEVILEADEVQALKLHDVDGLDHVASAEKMSISQPTFGRVLNSAYKKVADALVKGKAIRLTDFKD